MAGQVVMVLHSDGDSQRGRLASAFLKGGNAPAPLLIVGGGRLLEAGEDPHQTALQVVSQPAQLPHVEELHFPRRDVGPIGPHAEIGVAGQAGDAQAQAGQAVAQSPTGLGIVIQQRQVRPFGHQHDRVKAKGAARARKSSSPSRAWPGQTPA